MRVLWTFVYSLGLPASWACSSSQNVVATTALNNKHPCMRNRHKKDFDGFQKWPPVLPAQLKGDMLWQLEQNLTMFEDLKDGEDRSLQLAWWVIGLGDRVDRIIGRQSPEFIELDSVKNVLFRLVVSFTEHNRRICLPAIESAAAIVRGCKATLESWTDEEAAQKLSAVILQFPAA